MSTTQPPHLGERLARPRWVLLAALALALAVIALDLFAHDPRDNTRRGLFAAAAVGVMLILARGDRAALGLRVSLHRGWWWWTKLALLIGLGLGVVIALSGGVLWLLGNRPEVRSMFTAESQFRRVMWNAVIIAPVLEEPIYRLLLCVPIAAALGRWPAVIASGAVFGYLHFRYGNPSPDNFFAGYVLAWVYLESRSLVLPILLHAIGNAIVMGGHIALFYWL